MISCFHCGKTQPDENFDDFVCDCPAWDEYRQYRQDKIEALSSEAEVRKFDCDYPTVHMDQPCECVWKKRIRWGINKVLD